MFGFCGAFLNAVDRCGFKDMCTIEDVTKAYPLLDMVDHSNRRRIVSNISLPGTSHSISEVTRTCQNNCCILNDVSVVRLNMDMKRKE